MVWPDPGLEWIVRPCTPDEVVSDVNLHQIQGQARLDAFCRFLRTLGAALGSPRSYTPKGLMTTTRR